MHISEVKDLSYDDIAKEDARIKRCFQQIHFEDPRCMLVNPETKGYKSEWESNSNMGFIAYHGPRIAIVKKDDPDKESISATLQGLGYHVSEKGFYFDIRSYDKYGQRHDDTVLPEEILWEELKNGKGWGLIKKNLEGLLTPVLGRLSDVNEVRFAVYDPDIFEEPSDGWLPNWATYVEYDKIIGLPTYSNGLVNFDKLLEELKEIHPSVAIAISSKVKTKKGERHIPMIDFLSGVDYWDALKLTERLRMPERVLVESGNSYHHYDPRMLLNQKGFENYVGMIGMQLEIGKSWPIFQAIQDFSLLRITPCSTKPFFPTIEEG